MRKLIPFLNSPVAPPKQTTQRRFETVFAALRLALNVWSCSFGQRLVAWMDAVYTRITTMLYGEPSKLKAQLQLWRAFYVAYLRAGYDAALLSWPKGGHVRVEGYIRDLVTIRESYKNTLPADMLQFFDSIVFAFLSLDRVMSYEVAPNYDSITAAPRKPEPNQEGSLENIVDHLASLGITPEDFRAEFKRRCRAQGHIIFSTAGPNGPASWTAHTDARTIMADTGLYAAFQAFAEEAGMSRFVQDLLGTVSLPSYDIRVDHHLRSARLHSFEEWGGKCRTVAILDYWTQLILTPLHDTIFHFLSLIPADGTFNQEAVAMRVKSFTTIPECSIYSYDLSSATDRLPVALQERVLSILLGPSLAANWRRLLVDREYFTSEGKGLTYAVGQPMGAKSSWAMFTLTHHVIVQAAAASAGAAPYTEYGMVGDDVVITGSTIAEAYTTIMSYYDVSINMAKSLVPFAGAAPAAEICKRVFVSGVELSVWPVKLIAKTVSNGRLAPGLQNHITSRLSLNTAKAALTWIAGLIDRESLEFLTVLNMLPKEISGINIPQLDGVSKSKLHEWYPNVDKLDVQDIITAYTYTAVVEQLKRLDTLLRQTQIITAAIETNAFGYHVQQISTLGWQYANPNFPIEKLAASMPRFNATHPIVKASVAEVDRIGDLLAALRTGDKDLTASARARLLDMFRNALVDAWADAASARGQAERSLVQRALTTLTDVCLHRKGVKSEKGVYTTPAHTISFTTMLAYLNRMWTVDFTIGSPIGINSVKSRVAATKAAVDTVMNTVESNISFATRFAPVRKGLDSAPVTPKPKAAIVNPHTAHIPSTS